MIDFTCDPEPLGPQRLRVEDLEHLRPALARHCRRMLRSSTDVDDAVQDTMLRAWRGRLGFDGRAPLNTWLYRIATNVCLDVLRGRQRRPWALNVETGWAAERRTGASRDHIDVEPFLGTGVAVDKNDPVELAAQRESVRLAFATALQRLPPRQRAAVILRDVLRWRAREVAELLDTSVVAVTSALQRGRVNLAGSDGGLPIGLDESEHRLLDQYVDAFIRADVTLLVSLLREEAVRTSPARR